MTQTRDVQSALETFRQHGGVMKTSQALTQGVHPAALYRLVEDGQLMRLARGLYRLTSTQEFSNPDLAVVAAKAPEAVVCLIWRWPSMASRLRFRESYISQFRAADTRGCACARPR